MDMVDDLCDKNESLENENERLKRCWLIKVTKSTCQHGRLDNNVFTNQYLQRVTRSLQGGKQ